MKDGKPTYKFTISSVSTPFHKIGKTYEEITEICRESGFAGIEGSVPLFDNRSEGELQKIGKLFQDAGLQIETFHLPHVDPVKDDIATLYEVDREKVESNMKRIIDQAVILGSSIGILHPTTREDYNTNVEGIDRLLGQAGKTLDTLLRHGVSWFSSTCLLSQQLRSIFPRKAILCEKTIHGSIGDRIYPISVAFDTGYQLPDSRY